MEKVEIQNQDSHFSTAQISLRRKEKNCRLHKTLDAPPISLPRSLSAGRRAETMNEGYRRCCGMDIHKD
jgi:hypothetical protein